MIYDSNYIISKFNDELTGGHTIDTENDLIDYLNKEHIDNNVPLNVFSDIRLKIAEHMKLDSVLFLFGNGVSLYAGSKDTREFSFSEMINKAEYNEIKDDVSKIKTTEIEKQINALIAINSYYELTGDSKGTIIKTLIDDIKSRLISDFVNSIDYKSLKLHKMLLLKLRNFGCLNKSRIYTSNYDLAFEYTMDELGIVYNDGFSGFINRMFDPRALTRKDEVQLVKVHGSINWNVEENKVKELQPVFKDGKISVDDSSPVLIYPSSNKLYQTYATPYSELMRHMLDDMGSGKNVIVVMGYKYGDEHINEILYKSLENPNNVYYFFKFNETDGDVFFEALKPLSESMPNINILEGNILASFETFVKYIMPATPEKTDQERALELLKKVLV